jgi:hypothetical protein
MPLLPTLLSVQSVIAFEDGTHVGFEDQVVLGDAEVVPDILPWLTPLLLWLITALSSLGVPYLPYALGQIYKQRRLAAEGPSGAASAEGSAAIGSSTSGGGGGLLGAAKPGEARALARLDRVFGKLLVNPLDIALLEQQAARKEAPRLLKVGFVCDLLVEQLVVGVVCWVRRSLERQGRWRGLTGCLASCW